MALGSGISVMGRGAAIDPETFAARQKLADELYRGAIQAPQQPELSWTQGAARLAQALASGYERASLNKDREAYKQQRLQDMQKLGNALGGGDYKSVIGQLSDPDSQMMAFSLAKSDMDRQHQNQNQLAMKQIDFDLDRQKYAQERSDKREDRNLDHQFDIKKLGVADEYKRGGMQYQSQLQREQKMADPIKAAQGRYAEFARLSTDENASPELRDFAKAQLEGLQKNIAAMSPPKTSVSVDTGDKAEQAGLKTRKMNEEKLALSQEQDNKKAAYTAQDNIFRMNQIQKAIESGELTNVNTTDFGKGLETLSARLGLPNDSAAIANFIQSANQQLVDARKQFQGQGQVSDSETRLLQGTVLQPNDTMEAVRSKINVFNQIYDRQKALGDLTNEWVKRFGSTTKPAPNGTTFYQAASNLYKQRPLTSLEDDMRAKQEAASQNAGRP